MRFYFVILTFLFEILTVSICHAQIPDIRFKHITSEQGLSNSTVEVIFQDSRGFIWFGTRDGLNRYDGYNIRIYKNNSADTNSISDNYITCIAEDANNMLWIGTKSGLNRLDLKTGKFKRFKTENLSAGSLSNNQINAIHRDEAGKIWIASSDGLNLYQPQNGSFVRFYPQKSKKGGLNYIKSLLEDNNGYFWLGTEAGLLRFNTSAGTFSIYSKYPAGAGYAIQVLSKDKTGNIWIGSNEKGLYYLQPETGNFQQYLHNRQDPSSIASNLIRSILIDQLHNVWIGGVNGNLNLFLPGRRSFQRFTNESSDPASLSQRTVSALYEDKQGNIWIGTHRGGVNLYTPGRQNFEFHGQQPGAYGLSRSDVKSFYEDDNGLLWIGTDGGGLNCFNPVTRQYTHYRHNPFDPQSIGSDEVLHVTGDRQGNLWVSTWGGGLNLLNRQTGKFTRFVHDQNDLSSIGSNFVQQVFEDDEARLWVATYYGGLYLLDRQNRTFKQVTGDEKQLSHITGKNFVSICQDARGDLWFGTDDGGLNRLVKTTGQFRQYFVQSDKFPDLRVLYMDSRKRLWAGQQGLYLYDEAQDQFFLYKDRAGLSADFIKGILEDETGIFWISTSNGIVRYHPEKNTFKRYSTVDGLQSREFEAGAYYKTKNGQMLFGGVNGYNAFYPSQFQVNLFLPPVYFTELYLSNERITPGNTAGILPNDLAYTNALTLSYSQATFSVEFAALNYINTEQNQYAFRMVGLDDQWNLSGTARRATYTNLAPGKYTFEVKAANNDGVWNTNPARLSVYITPPFWQTWWFKMLVIVIVLIATYLLISMKRRYEIQQIEKSKSEEMHQMQLQFFTNISHEFRTPLSLILGPLEKIQKEDPHSPFYHYYVTMHRNASRLMELITVLMDFRKVEGGALKLKTMPGNIHIFVNEIADEFMALAREKSIDFRLDIPNNLPQAWFDRQTLEKILINLIGNAFKYTSSGGTIRATVRSNYQDIPKTFKNELVIKNEYAAKEYLYIQIADNGIGISADSLQFLFERYYRLTDSHLGSGVGLAFVKSLTRLHKGIIYVQSERHKGTEITIGLPIGAGDYTDEEKWIKSRKDSEVDLERLPNETNASIYKPQAIANEVSNTGARKHILLVDDNIELRHFLKESLNSQFEIFEADEGGAGLCLIRDKMPDLVISDVMMPGMDGIEFCRQIKENPATGHIPVIMLTAKAAIESQLEGINSGADHYFSKPLNTDLLIVTIQNIFENQQTLKTHWSNRRYSEALAATHSSKEQQIIELLSDLIEKQISNPELDVDYIGREMNMSRSKLYQTVKAITGLSIGDYVRTVRLRKAAQIMTEEDVLIVDVMYRVGMQTQSYFTKAFKKEFGKTPSQFLQDLGK
ncbi:two-component regulator propeller domain-containing protein [Niabella yanshanensis]|uniref:histidine kinase n=1 Tax=Niabella yanshanensis TaxID=577386 RepID=A0ABZ0W5N3_9BACT|nr:hybrid sensor histidine kinase/response regulator transcription factor [Niabella yanshanensis]WQD37999.1 two-component regulator propeller domain-containing protein [Niabella yanshanensis]